MSTAIEARRVAGRPRKTAKPTTHRAREVTAPIEAWIGRFKNFPGYSEIAKATGLKRQEVGWAFRGERRTPRVQDAIARHAGMNTAELFGEWAWFKGVAMALEAKLERRASA